MGLSRFKIRTRLYGGFMVLILIGLLTAAIGVWQLAEIGRQAGLMADLTWKLARAVEMSRQLETIRRAETRLRLDGDPAALVDLRDHVAQVHALLATSIAQAISVDRQRIYIGMQAALGDYQGQVDRFTEAGRSAAAEREAVLAAGERLTRATGLLVQATGAQAEAARMHADGLLLRLAAERFLATDDPAQTVASLGKARASLAAFGTAAGARAGPAMSAVDAGLADVAARFRRLMDARTRGTALYEQRMRPAILAMQQQIETARLSLVDSFTASDRADAATVRRSSWLQGLLAAGGLSARDRAGDPARARDRAAAGHHDRRDGPARRRGQHGRDPRPRRRDEIGDMARAVEVFRRTAIETDRLTAARTSDQLARDRRARQLQGLVHGFEAKVGGLVTVLSAAATELQATAQSMSGLAAHANEAAATVAVAAEEAGAGVQTAAAAAEQLAASISEIGRQVGQSSRIAGQAVADASRTDAIERALAEGAQAIGQVVELISTIAGQTNLLGEAARNLLGLDERACTA